MYPLILNEKTKQQYKVDKHLHRVKYTLALYEDLKNEVSLNDVNGHWCLKECMLNM